MDVWHLFNGFWGATLLHFNKYLRHKRLILVSSILIFMPLVLGVTPTARSQSISTPIDSLKFDPDYNFKIGITGSSPFVLTNTEPVEGISISLWQEMSKIIGINQFQFIPQPTASVGIQALIQGQIDILVGPISINADRLELVSFTQPYYQADIGLAVQGKESTLWERFRPLFQTAVISSICFLVLALFLVANIIWLAERRRNSQHFPKAYLPGIESGMWFALVTLTTVGYGDKAPITKTGKLITSIWMLITMVAGSSLTAGIATAFTLSISGATTAIFNNPSDIRDARIAVVEGTTGYIWAEDYNARLVVVDRLDTGMKNLEKGMVEGVLFDVPAIQYYLATHPDLNLRIAPVTFAVENYGFAVPLGDQLLPRLNVALLKLKETNKLQDIESRWLGPSP